MIDKNEIRNKIYAMDSEEFKAMIIRLLDDAGVDYTLGEAGLPVDGLELCEDMFSPGIKFNSPIQISAEKITAEYSVPAAMDFFTISDMDSYFDSNTCKEHIAAFAAA